ncbi:multidrug effflux MFS transporter [Saccharopolyspora sp. NFXS83]|uniref:multidrug effflux MFS transporter n=1 Tax=Saccharopolyspora sp. NFXS83 TaxID=2993560 RepID=UPI00224A84B6|nr:multidrug effflux MFS transporter [Saccharopolyspora sp. NFXS83]MCX2733210.1 multidrug effflux MFS transporter [Saccharopolyspora sp. NFXS83]
MSTPEDTTIDGAQRRLGSKTKFALILGGMTAFGPLSIDMYLPALPQLTTELGATESQAQLTLTAVLLGLALGQLLAGPISDSVGRRRPLLVGLTVYIVASVLCALSGSIYALAGLRLLQGAGAAAGMVIARAAVRDLYSGVEAARFFSSLMLVTGLAPILAPVVGGQVLAHTTWRGVFVVLTAFGTVLLLVAAFLLPETKPKQWRQPAHLGSTFRTFGALLSAPSFLGNALTGGLGMAAMFAYISGSSFVLQNIYAMSPQTYSIAFGANAIGLVLAGQINARLVGRVASEAQLLVGALLTSSVAGAVLLTAALLNLPLPFLLGPLFVMVSALGFVMPNTTMLALADNREVSGSASALLGVCQFIVGALAAPLVGLGGTGSAVPMTMVMFGVVVAATVMFLTLGRRGLKRPEVVASSAEVRRSTPVEAPAEPGRTGSGR